MINKMFNKMFILLLNVNKDSIQFTFLNDIICKKYIKFLFIYIFF